MQNEAVDRVKLIFTLFDADGSGALTAADFELMASRVVAVSKSDDAARQAMTAAFQRYWDTLANELDVNRDGTISYEEFEKTVLSPALFADTIDEFARALAALGDPDGDGRIERPVFTSLMTAIGFARNNIDALFDAFSPDADGRITVAAWRAGIKDYYRPDAAGIPGDQLVRQPA